MQEKNRLFSPRKKIFAKVAIPIPVDKLFTYEVPAGMEGKVFPGRRVEVPFGKRVLSGVVVDLCAKSEVKETKPIREVSGAYLSAELLKLSTWMASYYGCSLGEAIQSVLPASVRRAKRRPRFDGVACLSLPEGDYQRAEEKLSRAPRQLAVLRALRKCGGGTSLRALLQEQGCSKEALRSLAARGWVALGPSTDPSPLEAMDREVAELSKEQEQALGALEKEIDSGGFSPFLLHGVTGSGKTEVYLRAARHVLSKGGGCIVLVPEIGLLPQATARYRRYFGQEMAIIHSRLSGAERYDIWERIEKGEHRLVLGPRSAVFSPVKNLKLIIVDEEQDDSYKQEEKPRYHARNVALMRGKFENLTILLGSATPSVESLKQALNGKYAHLSLPQRIGGNPLPRVAVVDMRKEKLEGTFFSGQLLQKMEACIRNGYQSIIFLNKRGHARFVQCSACGWIARCRNCDISLTYHRVGNRMRCHFCGFSRETPSRCEVCTHPKLFFSGVGTQRVELDLRGFLPGVGILRMDADTTAGKEGHRKILERFGSGRYGILIGTQMVAKGHHFPGVHLVGVLHAEEGLNYPDFRSAEKTFQQLVQVSGRAGRAGRSGEVIVQTFVPEHYVFSYLKRQDYAGFMREELKVRKQLKYPPFSRIVLASCSCGDREVLEVVMKRWTGKIRKMLSDRSVEVLGPAPPLVGRLKGRYREQVLLKGQLPMADKRRVLESFTDVITKVKGGRKVELKWDVDPESFY